MKSSLLISAAIFSLPTLAAAQPATDAAAAASDEIIITATRRPQALSDVPIAVTAVSGEQLRLSGGTDIRQLNQLVPSLFVSTATNDSNAAARIRGVGTVGENAGLESSVVLFVDGVYRARTGVGLTELGELEQIEVLRGPQGTLFGRNSTAGLISITTARPKFENGGILEASYGNLDAVRLAGSLYGPLSQTIAFRFDGVYQTRDGFLTDVVSGRQLADRNRFLLRGQLLLKPREDITLRLIGDYNQRNEECCGAAIQTPITQLQRDAQGNVVAVPNSLAATLQQLGGLYPQAPDGRPFTRRAAITPGEGYFQRTRDWGFSGELTWDFSGFSLTSVSAYRQWRNTATQDGDFQSLDILRRRNQRRQFQTFTQELRLQGKTFGDRLDVLIGGYFANETLRTEDDLRFGNDFETVAACVQADSFARGQNRLDMVDPTDPSCFNRSVTASVLAGLAPGTTANTIRGLSGLGAFPDARGFDPRGGYYNAAAAVGYAAPGALLADTGKGRESFRQTSRNFAVFSHNVLEIVPDRLDLTLGARYTNERKSFTGVFDMTNGLCPALRASSLSNLAGLPCALNGSAGTGFSSDDPGTTRNEQRLTGTAVLSFRPVDTLLTYASYSRGYKAGGFNLDTSGLPSTAPLARELNFEPEEVDAFELGAKLGLPGFTLNAALFYQSFRNFQFNGFNGINFEVANIGGCKADLGGRDRDLIAGNSPCPQGQTKAGVVSKGVELEALLMPIPDLTLSGGFTYADARFADQLTGRDGASLPPTLFQLPGSRLSNAPAYTATASIAWTPPIQGTAFSSLFSLDMRYSSELNTGSDLDREKLQPAFTLVNARIGLYGPARRWGLEVWATNLFNTLYQQVGADAPLQGGGTAAGVARGLQGVANQVFLMFPGEPRTYGLTLRSQF
jgi:outer membrane receptor protein involved in Fe transport